MDIPERSQAEPNRREVGAAIAGMILAPLGALALLGIALLLMVGAGV